MSAEYPNPQNAVEQQAAKDALAASLAGQAAKEQQAAQEAARRLERKHGLNG